MKVKCISLWQPWASLWAAGIKIHETRDWPTKHRGLLAVHAAKHKDADAEILFQMFRQTEHVNLPWNGWPKWFDDLPFGAIVGVVHVDDCYPTDGLQHLPWPDRKLGNFTAGRFAWLAENARLFKEPIPWKGQQGFFTVEIPDPVAAALPQASSPA